VPITCRLKSAHGHDFCGSDCPAAAPCGVFRYARVEAPDEVPAPDPLAVDVAVLDMNHGWPNLGHDSLVHAVLDAGCDLLGALEGTGIHVRVLSYDVRRGGMVPEGPGGRFGLYLGTGGPAHFDPRRNDGVAEGSQGIHEDPAWEAPFFGLLDAVAADESSALLAVCHTFGVMCRWSGVAEPAMRGPEKGGKSAGILENVLTPEAQRHPWFGRFARELPDGRRLRILDNRLFDLLPTGPLPPGATAIGYETLGVGGRQGGAITMIEFARDRAGVMPRVFAVNHHPEIVDRARQVLILEQKHERGEVSREWFAERMDALTRTYPEENSDFRLHATSDYTLLGPLRFQVKRLVRERAERLGFEVAVHEDHVLEELHALGAPALG
jgi:hypothetical protein